jgi:hypothetical protein
VCEEYRFHGRTFVYWLAGSRVSVIGLWSLLSRNGLAVYPNRVYRPYLKEQLAVPRLKRRHLERVAPAAVALTNPIKSGLWTSFRLRSPANRSIHFLTVIGRYTRECLATDVDGAAASHRRWYE